MFCFFFTFLLDGTTRYTTSFSSHGNASNGTKATQHDTYAPWYPPSWNDATNGPGKTVRLRCKGFACFLFLSCWYWEAMKDDNRYRHQELKLWHLDNRLCYTSLESKNRCNTGLHYVNCFSLDLRYSFYLKAKVKVHFNPYPFWPLGAQCIAQNTHEIWNNQNVCW